ncbi:uncharacterized protein J5F26_010768 isoform 1-T1 [Ciconia maguari]
MTGFLDGPLPSRRRSSRRGGAALPSCGEGPLAASPRRSPRASLESSRPAPSLSCGERARAAVAGLGRPCRAVPARAVIIIPELQIERSTSESLATHHLSRGSWLYCRHQSLMMLSLVKRSVRTSIA